MSQRTPLIDSSVHTMVDDHSTKVFQVYDGKRTVYVLGTTYEDAKHTCYVHDYLDDTALDWEVAEITEADRDRPQAWKEAHRRHDALHGR